MQSSEFHGRFRSPPLDMLHNGLVYYEIIYRESLLLDWNFLNSFFLKQNFDLQNKIRTSTFGSVKSLVVLLQGISIFYSSHFCNLYTTYFSPIGIIPARYMLAVLSSVGMAIAYGLKVNLSVAMVGMLNHTALKAASGQESDTTKQVDISNMQI